MTWNVAVKWLMLVSGLLTCTMIYAAVAPEAAMLSTFGEALDGPLAGIVVRNWGVLIALVGAMLIYGAFNPPVRRLVLVVAAASKLVFIGLVLLTGRQYLGPTACSFVRNWRFCRVLCSCVISRVSIRPIASSSNSRRLERFG